MKGWRPICACLGHLFWQLYRPSRKPTYHRPESGLQQSVRMPPSCRADARRLPPERSIQPVPAPLD